MSLRTKRNLPLVFVLLALLSILTLTMGNQRIISYTFHLANQPVERDLVVASGIASSD